MRCDVVDIENVVKTAFYAGRAILDVYNSDFNFEDKEDKTPLTLADKESHRIICRELNRLYPDIPVLSEEGKSVPYEVRKKWECFWLVDPLDGTKEFIKRNGEFTVNIALIDKDTPVLGVIGVPVKNLFYFAGQGSGTYKMELPRRQCSEDDFRESFAAAKKVFRQASRRDFTVVGSRTHMSQETRDFIEKIKNEKGNIEMISAGSSLKFCMVAEGKADMYPRFGPTCEWDTAAGQVILETAGGKVVEHTNYRPLYYNKEDLVNPWFIAMMG